MALREEHASADAESWTIDFMVVAVLNLAACHMTLLAEYDAVFDREATDAQKDVDALYLKIIDNNPYRTGRAAGPRAGARP